MDNQYFTPEIEDIRVGYEYQYKAFTQKALDGAIDPERWDTAKFPDPFVSYRLDSFQRLIEDGKIRVPYLTKEQIEAEGWVVKNDYGAGTCYRLEGNYRLDTHKHGGLTYDLHNIRIFKLGLFESPGDKLYDGECKDINTFRYICKLLNIQ